MHSLQLSLSMCTMEGQAHVTCVPSICLDNQHKQDQLMCSPIRKKNGHLWQLGHCSSSNKTRRICTSTLIHNTIIIQHPECMLASTQDIQKARSRNVELNALQCVGG